MATAQHIDNLEYFFSVDDDGHFRLTSVQPFNFHGQLRVLAMSGNCRQRTMTVASGQHAAQASCKQGDVQACLTAGAELEGIDRRAALAMLVMGCSRSGTSESEQRALAAKACTEAARVADLLGASGHAENLRKQAAQIGSQK